MPGAAPGRVVRVYAYRLVQMEAGHVGSTVLCGAAIKQRTNYSFYQAKCINKKILLPCFSVTGMAPEDKHIAVSWVGVAYTGMLCVCLGGNAVLRRAEFANCTSVQMVSACVLGAVVVLCAVVSCCSSVVSCGCLVFRNTQVHSCFLSPHLSNDDCPFPLLHLYDHPTEDPTPVPLQQQHQHQHQHQCHYRHQHQRREER